MSVKRATKEEVEEECDILEDKNLDMKSPSAQL